MSKKLALKKLKSSDLSFFKSYLIKHPQSKQKGLNLDLKIMEGVFYPGLRTLLEPKPKHAAHIDLTLYGPGVTEGYPLARKVKRDAKNIRLNGEIVDAPMDDPERYETLAPDDFAILEFSGDPLPDTVNVVLVSAAHPDDAALHATLTSRLPGEGASMEVVTEDTIAAIIEQADPITTHPIRCWLDSEVLENLGRGDGAAVEALNKRPSGKGISPAAFKISKESAEKTGFLGELLLNQFLAAKPFKEIVEHEWVAQINAISPYDFKLKLNNETIRHADAKSTSGKFDNPVFLSIAEIRHAAQSGLPYDIYRLYRVTEKTASLRIARNVGPLFSRVLTSLQALPAGVNVDALSFDTSFFPFDEKLYQLEDTD